MKYASLLFILLISMAAKSQTCYSGHLGTLPITLVMYHYGDGDSRAYYVYNKYDTPITINGTLNDGVLTLFEKDGAGENSAIFVFEHFTENDQTIKGKWINADSSKTFQVLLKFDFDLDYGYNLVWESKELIQSQSTKEHYFKTVINKDTDAFFARITAVKIFEKGTDKLIQTLEVDCQLFGIDNIFTGDYNFDGIEDFSVFEASYAGPNTSRIYFLKDPNSNNYLTSNFSGTSLEFDNEAKLIREHNQCCAGRSHMNATYKVVNNEMVLIEQKCLEYDEDKEEFIETDCE